MSKALKTINQDAAYALGEEAFRAGWQARDERSGQSIPTQAETDLAEDTDWSDYEPSEAVKDLIVS